MRKVLFVMIVCMCLFVVSCNSIQVSRIGQSGTNQEKIVVTGYNGLSFDFVPDSPPEQVYEDDSFAIGFEVVNHGGYDVTNDEAILNLGVERDYNCVRGWQNADVGSGVLHQTCDEVQEDLNKVEFSIDGRKLTMPKGESRLITYEVLAKQIDSQSEFRESMMFATLCYPYETTLETEVCIDPDPLDVYSRSKVCELVNMDFPEGQGAPVAITKVEPRIVNVGDTTASEEGIIQPHFSITIENKGSGEVIQRSKVGAVCTNEQFTSRDNVFNHLRISGSVSGKALTCDGDSRLTDDEPQVRLIEGKDEIRCYLADSTIKRTDLAFLTPLQLTLEYGYTESTSASYEILSDFR